MDNSPNFQNSLKGETRDKFDALLKEALNLKSRKNAHNQSTQKLISDGESVTNSTENLPGRSSLDQQQQIGLKEIVKVDVHGGFKHDNFILNKFLNDSSNMRVDTKVVDNLKDPSEIISLDVSDSDATFVKPPVPRPRKSQKALMGSPSSLSANTFKNISPTVTKRVIESKASKESKNLLPQTNPESDESTNTYVLETTADLNASVMKKVSRKSQLPASDIVDIKSLASRSSNNTENDEATPKSKSVCSEISDRNCEKIELMHFSNDQIQYENEIKPKNKVKQSAKLLPKLQSTFRELVETVIHDQKEPPYTYENITGIIIHKADRLRLDSLVIHPVVKIHIVDGETGNYLTKSDKNRSVVFYYESKDTAYITPVISEAYNLYEKCSLQPAWEETLLINEDIDFIIADENNTIIFFEILDFVSFSVASSQFSQKDSSRGWHKIAWAFFKPLGKNNVLNINKKARLQLYYPGKYKKVPPHVCEIFHWWSKNKRIKYPSSLYVSVISIRPPDEIRETLRSKTPIHGEKASTTVLETRENSETHENFLAKSVCSDKLDEKSSTKGSEVTWSRSSYQICKLPNKLWAQLSSYEEGCLMMKFSHNGLYLACAVLIDGVYSSIVYSVTLHKEVCRYPGHQGLIYDIAWSPDDQLVITASADCTVCVWNFAGNAFVNMLPHPSYVYASAINSKNVIATGCYDHIVRIWCRTGAETLHNLVQELEQHKSYITSLCFNKKSSILYSSDATGVIIEWKHHTTENIWNLKREFKLVDLKDTIINEILLHTKERRLLIHARDSALRIIDLKTGCVLYWLQGAVNTRVKTTCSFSACGSFILAGSENGFINVWNSDLGQHVATYTPYDEFNYQHFPVHCIQFHPLDNILAISHYGHSFPILLAMYNSDFDGKSNLGLKMLHKNDEVGSLRKKNNSKPLRDFKAAAEKVVEEDGDHEKKLGKTKFEDVIQKIDQIVSRSRSTISASSSKSSFNN